MKKLIVILLVMILTVSVFACGETLTQPITSTENAQTTTNSTAQPSPKPAATTKPTPTPTPVMGEIEFMLTFDANNFRTDISYSDIAREPSMYANEYVAFNGEVMQVMQGKSYTQIRLAVDGDFNNVIFCEYYPESETINVLEGDWVSINGECAGEFSYESVMGATITLPAIMVCRIVEYDNSVPLEYDHGPFTFTENTYSGMRVTEIESFEITRAAKAYSGSTSLSVEYKIIGTVKGYDYLSISVKCYDDEGFLLDTTSVFSSVSDGERFRISDNMYVPLETVRIEFAAD